MKKIEYEIPCLRNVKIPNRPLASLKIFRSEKYPETAKLISENVNYLFRRKSPIRSGNKPFFSRDLANCQMIKKHSHV